ncbi:MAG: hypothetical protein EPN30_02340 [Actinomycetota bacterium]|nr:MAG: hypothetical protein EPN30_02340 [Actinomycetota bacterium]
MLSKSSKKEKLSKKAKAPRGRYTPKSERPKSYHSPRWVPISMFVFLALGVLLIIVNYLTILPGGASNWYLLGGLVLLAVGFWMATKYQ